jgi:hypothetical protein
MPVDPSYLSSMPHERAFRLRMTRAWFAGLALGESIDK